MGPGAIPVSEIIAYLDLHGIADAEDRREFAWLIRQMDDAYLDEVAKKNAAKES